MSLSLTFENAQVLGAKGLFNTSISVNGGLISEAAERKVDLSGYWVMPAFVDIHGDGFEHHLAPRRGVMKDLGQGLQSVDAEFAANGIATATMAQFFSWEGGMRGPDFARRFLEARAGADIQTDTRVQLRFETHLLDRYDDFEALVDEFQIPYVVFNDHIPHAALIKGKRPPRLTGQALKSGRSPEAHLELLKTLHAHSNQVPAALARLALNLRTKGVRLGSHDDAHADTRQTFHAMGANISEFPETLEAAETAKTLGNHIILGAPNVVRGGSHSGKISAQDLVGQGLCHALASDYHYPALKQAAFRLADEGTLPLSEAWSLVSEGPARLLGLSDRGTLDLGKRADLVILDPNTRRIEATMVAGRFSYLTGTVAERLIT